MYNLFLRMTRRQKRAVLLLADLGCLPLALIAAFSLRYGMLNPIPLLVDSLPVVFAIGIAGGVLIYWAGLHRIKLQNFEIRALGQIGLVALGLVGLAITASYLLNAATPRSVPVIFGASFFMLTVGYRLLGVLLLSFLRERNGGRTPVVIYGAGSAGIQIASALRASGDLKPLAFVDDNLSLIDLQVAGLVVHHPSSLPSLVAKKGVERIVLALPSISTARRKDILHSLSGLGCEVQMLPSHAELLERGSLADNLRTVRPDELLGRNKVDLNVSAVAKAYAGRCVLVTGAGGSIGSELCRQLVDCNPRQIVLLEHSEFALYRIDQELRASLGQDSSIEITTCLGSVTNKARVGEVILQNRVEIILHAAAYKHVPLVECNEVEGARNNVLGTKIVADAAIEFGVERFILVSTDKAVRPTNIMGATKRLAEMVVQDSQTRTDRTKLAMVRFGNVLGSSGSVLPLFQSQIEKGGPVTVTHPDVTRFFMTIPEAARLVLLAGAFSEGGDVFVLDMGKPMKIMDIARRMIELAGQTVQEATNRSGIEIKVTGLRPGEKLYEELLIDDESLRATPHEKILRAEEKCLSEIQIAAMLKQLDTAILQGDRAIVRGTVEKFVSGYQKQTAVS